MSNDQRNDKQKSGFKAMVGKYPISLDRANKIAQEILKRLADQKFCSVASLIKRSR